jgi:NAD(P)-dependent dehydrogenase (short-subunit alcohol dehydrogenase family)
VCLVTGSARRVGREIAIELARRGACVVVHYHSSEAEAAETIALVEAEGARALLVRGDYSRPGDMAGIAGRIDEAFGRLDALVNNASTFPRITFDQTSEADFDAAIAANLKGPYFTTQACLTLLRRSDRAHVVNLVDCMIDRPYANHSAYWCAKGGLDALTRALANELAPHIRVNAVAPGPVLAPEDLSEGVRRATLQRTPLGHWGTPGDVARVVAMLLESEFLTGVTIPVDGGRRLGDGRSPAI